MKLRNKILLAFVIATLSTSAHARAVATPQQLGVQALVQGIMLGIGWVMEEGTKSEKIPDPTSGSGSSSGSGSGTGTGESGSGGGTGTGGNVPAPAQTYPFEYWFDGQKFSSAESACSYAFGSYLSKKGLKKSRRQDGTYLEKTNIYIGSSGYFHSSVPGYFTCNTHAAAIDSSSCGQSNVCGSHYSWSGSMLYAGTEKTTTTTVSDDYAERRAKALQAVQKAVEDAQSQTGGRTGTGVGTGATTAPTTTDDGLARPVGVDTGTTTGVGTNTGVNTNTNANTTTNTTTNTNTTTTTTNTNTTNNVKTEPFTLPTFCGWAQTVCDFVDWFKAEPPQEQEPKKVPKADLSDLGLSNDELFKQRIQFDGQCPKHELRFSVNGHNLIKPIPTYHFCNLLEQLAPWLLAFSYLSSGFFVVRNL